MLMVKADAYGHGLKEVACAVEDRVDAFGVATLEEGEELRRAGVQKDILVLTCAPDEIKRAIDSKLCIGLGNIEQLSELARLIVSKIVSARDVKLHLALDSGMHRLGFGEKEIDEVLSDLSSLGLNVCGAYSHLRVRSYKQVYAFERMCARISEVYPNIIRHLASSHSMHSSRLRYDMVRVGLSAYEGAMSVRSVVLSSRRVEKGEFVSYGDYKLEEVTNTAVVFGGYADGASRENPSAVYIRGKECKVLGNVCMDMCIVDCGDFLPEVGEEVVFTDDSLIEEIAKQRNSIDYTVMTCWRGRIERIYSDDKSGGEAVGEESGLEDEC